MLLKFYLLVCSSTFLQKQAGSLLSHCINLGAVDWARRRASLLIERTLKRLDNEGQNFCRSMTWALQENPLCAQGQGAPLRMPNGIHRNRLSLIMAVLTKHARLRLHSVDCHTNVVGGLTLTEPATDLAVALAVASSYFEQPIGRDFAVIGEIGELLVPVAKARAPFG